jgi:hypothetical protein
MTPPAESCLSPSETSGLHCLIRLAVESNDYYTRLSETEIEAIGRGIDYRNGSAPYFEAAYQLDSIMGGISTYKLLSSYYNSFSGSPRPSPTTPINLSVLRNQHLLLFDQLSTETDFTKGFCAVLDLFRIQLLWFGLIA